MAWNIRSFSITVIDILIVLTAMFYETTVMLIQVFDEFIPLQVSGKCQFFFL